DDLVVLVGMAAGEVHDVGTCHVFSLLGWKALLPILLQIRGPVNTLFGIVSRSMGVELTPAVDPDTLRWERCQRRVRGELAGATVVQSCRAVYVWEPGVHLPEYAVPRDDVVGEL